MQHYVSSSYFEVMFAAPPIVGLSGRFTNVSGLGMEFEYDTYTEGGTNFPRYFFKNSVPQTLTLHQGTVTMVDLFSNWIASVNVGMGISLNGVIVLKDHTGMSKRSWIVMEAFPLKYIGPTLDSMKSELAVSTIELRHNGCF